MSEENKTCKSWDAVEVSIEWPLLRERFSILIFVPEDFYTWNLWFTSINFYLHAVCARWMLHVTCRPSAVLRGQIVRSETSTAAGPYRRSWVRQQSSLSFELSFSLFQWRLRSEGEKTKPWMDWAFIRFSRRILLYKIHFYETKLFLKEPFLPRESLLRLSIELNGKMVQRSFGENLRAHFHYVKNLRQQQSCMATVTWLVYLPSKNRFREINVDGSTGRGSTAN